MNFLYAAFGALIALVGVIVSKSMRREKVHESRAAFVRKSHKPRESSVQLSTGAVLRQSVEAPVGSPHRRGSENRRSPVTALRADAVLALTTMGFRSGEACTAVDQARTKLGEGAVLETLIREALRCVAVKEVA